MTDRTQRYHAIVARNERIRALRNSGVSDEQIAADFGMALSTVRKFAKGRT